MSSKWFAKHFVCWSGRDKDQSQQRSTEGLQAVKNTTDTMLKLRNSKRNCAKDGTVKCCDKFCKNHCNLSMIRNDLIGGNVSRRSVPRNKSSKFETSRSLLLHL